MLVHQRVYPLKIHNFKGGHSNSTEHLALIWIKMKQSTRTMATAGYLVTSTGIMCHVGWPEMNHHMPHKAKIPWNSHENPIFHWWKFGKNIKKITCLMLNFKFLPLFHGKKMAIPHHPPPRQGTVKRRCPAPRCRSAPWRDPRRRCAARPPPRRSDLPRRRELPPDHGVMGWKSMGKIPRNSNPSIYKKSKYILYI